MIRFPRRHCAARRWWAGAAGIGAAAAAVALTGVSPALAANDYLEFSLDGKTYSATTSGPVFSEAFTYSPGTSSTAALWVRNTSNEPASLSAAANVARSAPELDGYLGMSAGIQPGVLARSPLGAEASCTNMDQAWEIGAGEERELSLVFDLSVEAPNSTMNRTADIDLLFLLEPATAGNVPRPACAALTEPDLNSTAPGVVPGLTPGARPGGPAGEAETAAGPAGPSTARLTALPGIRTAPAAAGPAGVWTAAMAADTGAGTSRGNTSGVTAPQRGDIQAAGFQSTVEPIIRSLSGTLLIGMSVVFTAAVVLRVRSWHA